MADMIIEMIFDRPVFTWGAGNLSKESENRKQYLNALKLADSGNYEALLRFARS